MVCSLLLVLVLFIVSLPLLLGFYLLQFGCVFYAVKMKKEQRKKNVFKVTTNYRCLSSFYHVPRTSSQLRVSFFFVHIHLLCVCLSELVSGFWFRKFCFRFSFVSLFFLVENAANSRNSTRIDSI